MTPARILMVAPTDPVMTVAEVKTLLGITSDTSDALIGAQIAAAAARLDPASGGWLGRALRPQTWELRMRQFPSGEIRLPYPPVTEVSSVKYDDGSGVERTLVEGTDYRVFDLDDFQATTIAPLYNGVWPIARYDRESVRIRYVAGYGGSPDPLPDAIKSAIAFGVEELRLLAQSDATVRSEATEGIDSVTYATPRSGGDFDTACLSLLSTLRVYF